MKKALCLLKNIVAGTAGLITLLAVGFAIIGSGIKVLEIYASWVHRQLGTEPFKNPILDFSIVAPPACLILVAIFCIVLHKEVCCVPVKKKSTKTRRKSRG